MGANIHHLKSRRALLSAVGAVAVLAVAGFATSQAWGQSTGTAGATTAPAPAGRAATGDQLTVAKNRVDLRVDRAVAAIDRVSARVPSDANLSAAERSTVSGDLGTLRSGLVALKAKVDADSTAAAIKADVKAARLAAKGDAGTEVASLYRRADDAATYLDAVAGRVSSVQGKLSALKASGRDVTALQSALSDLQAKVTDARSHLAGFDGALLSPEPTGPAQIATATTALKAEHTDVAAIRKDLQSLRQARAAAKSKAAAG